MKTEGRSRSSFELTYEPHGALVRSGCDVDADGKVTRCLYPSGSTQHRWNGVRLIASEGSTKVGDAKRTSRSSYRYDRDGRLVGEDLENSRAGGGLEVVERTRYEYRCKGAYIDTPLWPRR